MARAHATVSATAHLTVTGFEQGTDSGTVMVSFNGFTETIPYTQFSSNVSLAGTLAALFTRDYHAYGLWAKAGANVTDLNVITFQLTNGKTFGSISYTLPSTSFGLVPSGFGSNGAVTADSGLVTLYVGGSAVAATRYGDGSTPASITEDLASSSSTNNLVSVKADGDLLYVTAQQPGSGSDFPYNVTITHDTQDFPLASFQVTPMSGSLTGGADAGPAATPTVVYSYTAQYDTASNVRVLNDSVMGNWSYGYDALNRLTAGQAAGGPYASQPFLCWSYDNFGNRTHQSQSNQPFVNAVGSPCQAAPGGTFLDAAAGYGSNNQITSMAQPGQPVLLSPSYDAAGDVVNDGTTTYLYDAEGRVCAVHGVYGMTGYQYDADGNRVGKGTLTSMSCDLTVNGYTPTNDYVLGPDNSQMTEVAITEGNRAIWQHTNVKADGMLIATYDTAGLHFYLSDALGTRRAQTDATGQWEQNCQSLPFGDQLSCTMSNDSPSENHFTGKERDAESGLDYFGARYFSSNMGRWMSPDWSSSPSGVPYADLSDPQSLNLYQYMRNNPLGGVDADGHVWQWLQKLWNVVSYPGIMNDPKLSPSQRDAAVKQAWADHDAAGRELVTSTIQLIGIVASAESPMGAPPEVTPPAATAPGISDATLADRANTIQAAQDSFGQTKSTTAAASVTDANGNTSIMVGSSRNALTPSQRAALQPGETAVTGPGHAETTVINAAQSQGMTVNSVAASRPVCPTCSQAIQDAGARQVTPSKPQ